MITLEQLGSKLKAIREKIGFSQEYVAEQLGVSRQAIISIEAGKRKVDSFELFKLASLFDIDVRELISEDKVEFSRFEDEVMILRKKEKLTNDEKKSLMDFQKICDDYEFLKKL